LKEVRDLQPAGALLEIGSSYGHFLALAREMGYRTAGVDVSPEGCEFARQHFELDVFCGTLDQFGGAAESFQVVTLMNTLEHLPDPFDTLVECHRLLSRNGILAIVVPNLLAGYPWVLWQTRVLHRSSIAVNMSAYTVPYHLFLYRPSSLRSILRSAGFQAIEIKNAPVIHNSRNPGRTLAKRALRAAANCIYLLSNRRFSVGYSILATARKS
jgi:2-polyprenyl-3-methyl-5-hydroxy-6-metoxy-1,4-benzoquinol methylase